MKRYLDANLVKFLLKKIKRPLSLSQLQELDDSESNFQRIVDNSFQGIVDGIKEASEIKVLEISNFLLFYFLRQEHRTS